MSKTVALYLRVSTGEQTIENQRIGLEAMAARSGWKIAAVFKDEGISGTKGRDKRPGFDQLLKGVSRREFDLVAAWSVDRIGRSLQDLLSFLGELQAKNVDLYLHQQGLDTSTPAGKAMFQMMGVFAEFERAMIVERVNSGIARARAQGKRIGRPSALTPEIERRAVEMFKESNGLVKVGRTLGIGTNTARRLRDANFPKNGGCSALRA